MGEGSEEKQSLVEADKVVRIVEFELRELREEFGDCGRVARVEAVLGGFELG